jgi:DNA repair exonuclease SbcCD ATPase subunit
VPSPDRRSDAGEVARIDIAAFGCLSDFSEEIAPGLPSSTVPTSRKIHTSAGGLSLLYGFYESDRAKTSENAARQRYVPWQDARYTARLEYSELQDGRRYRVAREFASADVPTKLWDLVSGRDVTDDFGRGRHGNVQFMRRQLGMTRRVFESCAFVSQGELLQVTGEGRVTPQEMGDAIISLADTARRDVSAQSAIDRLTKVLKEQVGGPQARAAPLPVARNRLSAAKRELEEIDRVRAEVAADAQALEQAREQARTLDETVTRNRYLLAQAEVTDIRPESTAFANSTNSRVISSSSSRPTSLSPPSPLTRRRDRRSWNSVRELRERLVNGQAETEGSGAVWTSSERRESLAQRSAGFRASVSTCREAA